MQEDIIESVLKNRDTLAILPTGGGKSICFQVPAMAMEGLCLVVSPLIALMKDQVRNLTQRDIPALAVYSGMDHADVKKTLQQAAFGKYKFLYVSPERLESSLFLEYLPALKPSLIAVDEAHCISQWGYDFRPSYLRIAELRSELKKVPVIALTASATLSVQDDICVKLLFKKDHARYTQSYSRPNLSYSVFRPPARQTKLLEILQNVNGTSIVYCKSRKQAQEINNLLNTHSISSEFYHAGLSHEQRTQRQDNWFNNKTRVIVCTNAFGMGIDKANVRVVVHYAIPDCLENYYQEAGRAGRDGKKAYAVLLYATEEINNLKNQIDIRFPGFEEIKKIYIALMNHLQVAAGMGEWKSFDFDIATFAENFKLNILQATYAIQAMAKEDILSYNEIFFKPSTLVFTTTRQDLEEFEIQYPEAVPFIKGLLRNYEGIFDFPATIYETMLAKFLKTPLPLVKAGLEMLHKYGIVRYVQQKDKPQIFLLRNRMYTDDFTIDTKNHLLRKEAYRNRVNAIGNYIDSSTICRSIMISNYFGDNIAVNCNICDNCLAKKETPVSDKEFIEITGKIENMLVSGRVHIKEIEKKFKSRGKKKLWKVLDYLMAENKIETDQEGFIFSILPPDIYK